MNIKQSSANRPPVASHIRNSNILQQNRYSILRSNSNKNRNFQYNHHIHYNKNYQNGQQFPYHSLQMQNCQPNYLLNNHANNQKSFQHNVYLTSYNNNVGNNNQNQANGLKKTKHVVIGSQTALNFQIKNRPNTQENPIQRQNFFMQSLDGSAVRLGDKQRGSNFIKSSQRINITSKRQDSQNHYNSNRLPMQLCNSHVFNNNCLINGTSRLSMQKQSTSFAVPIKSFFNSYVDEIDDKKSLIDQFINFKNNKLQIPYINNINSSERQNCSIKQDYARVFFEKLALQEGLKRAKAEILHKDQVIKKLSEELNLAKRSPGVYSHQQSYLNFHHQNFGSNGGNMESAGSTPSNTQNQYQWYKQ